MNMRSLSWLALAFTFLWIWIEWQGFVTAKKIKEQNEVVEESSIPEVNMNLKNHIKNTKSSSTIDANLPIEQTSTIDSTQRIYVKTDVYSIEMDTLGGDIRKLEFLKYGSSKDIKKPFQLMGDSGKFHYIAQNGIAQSSKTVLPAPTHKDIYKVNKTHYDLGNNKSLKVSMFWQDLSGIIVTKSYTFTKGSYIIDIDYSIDNNTNQIWSGSLYSQMVRNTYDPDSNSFMYTYTGPVVYDPVADSKYVKHSFDSLKTPVAVNTTGGWVAMIQHYFIASNIPSQTDNNRLYAKSTGDGNYVVGVVQPLVSVKPQQTTQLQTKLYIGPIIQDKLSTIAPGLERTVDYGILTVIAEPIFWLLEKIYALVGNWGWSIILLTILIKLIFYKLSETSYRSMAKMKKFSPKLKILKENYGNNKQLFQKKMMELYKKEKINPLGGCLPIIVQMPVFIALYWVLLYSAEMRQAPWILWIQDLSKADPFYILPVIMGVTMYIQQKLNPSDMMDEMQQKVMRFLPFIFTIFFMFFPSGLVLYWVVNNILSVGQQWYITQKIANENT